MVLKNLIFAVRNLWKDRFYTLLNGAGLAIAMAAVLFIFLWVNDELTFDNFHRKGDHIYRVLTNWSFAGNEEIIAATPYPLEAAARENVPEIEKIALMNNLWNVVLQYGDKRFPMKDAYLVDSDFFDIFDFKSIRGNVKTALLQPNQVVLTESLAKQIYGTTDVVGQPLEIVDKIKLTVSAVLEDVPSNSHIRFKMLLPFKANVDKFLVEGSRHWGAFNYTCYVLLRPGVDMTRVGEKLTALIPLEEGEERPRQTMHLQALADIYLGSDFLRFSGVPQGNIKTIRMISLIGLLILLIACINYVNMTTARSAHHAKSTGIRKVIGASRGQLFKHFLLEAVILVGFAGIGAIVMANLSLSIFEELSGKLFTNDQLFDSQSLVILGGIAFTAVLLAGIYPAIQLSAFNPLQALRGSNFNKTAGKGGLRKVLVVSQFACAGALIICTLVMLLQMHFVKNQKLGYDREQIFAFRAQDASAFLLKSELVGKPGIKEVTVSNNNIVDISNRYSGFNYEGKDPQSNHYLHQISVGDQFPGFFDLKLVGGRWFYPGNRDSSSFILNETAVKKLGITDPVGKWMRFNGIEGTIVGIARDFHFRSFHHPIGQLIFLQDFRWGMKVVYVKTTGEEATDAIASAENVFRRHEPNALFDYAFLDESYDQLYKAEARSSALLALFAGLAILISCLGILGLAAYTAERRQKEIGIRKVLGASVAGIVALLSKEFLGLVFWATVIASPVAWYFMQNWLEGFAYHIDIQWWVFIIAAIVGIAVAFLTVGFQSIKAALANPVDSLRSE